ncbi:PAS domain-containing protein [Kordiimonas marina]|uniref:PAS domain-containing protein n=1 Tax=Kordiimonas marina TaxID=2872312 RepID=UPI001FF1DB32|nr:PAS domain-containing protein [Kordiimonas marina]MCJ9427508.1 PAS domain-containing protein [Kordiimonas marina]
MTPAHSIATSNKISPEFTPFLACWQALPRSRHPFLPARSDCTPARLGPFLPNIGIGLHQGPGKMEVLYYGSVLEQVSGLKVTGMNYYDLLPEVFRSPLMKFHHLLFSTPCGAYIADFVKTEAGNQYLYESLQFPLTDDKGTPTYLLLYGLGRKPFTDKTDRNIEGIGRRAIKEMHYLDIGAGAPSARIEDFIFYR